MDLRQTKRAHRRHLPHIWLMTDPRLGENLLRAIAKLPPRSGVIFRHYGLSVAERRSLFRSVARICRRRGHILLLAGPESTAVRWHANGFYNNDRNIRKSPHMVQATTAHNVHEMARATKIGVDLIFLSPLFATASHPSQKPLGRTHFTRLAGLTKGAKVIALGGMNARKAATLDKNLVHGWAAIDAFKF